MPRVRLMSRNKLVLEASYDSELHAFLSIEDVREPGLVPYGARDGRGEISRRGLQEWWSSRSIPVTRDGYEQLRQSMGEITAMDLLEDSFGLSLSDQYWLAPEDFTGEWSDVNFFENGFDGTLGVMTLNGSSAGFSADSATPGGIGPSASLGGNLRKTWEIRESKRILLKAGSRPFLQEPFNEAIATALHSRLIDEGDFVPYTIEWRGGEALSACPCMVEPDESLIPAWDIIRAYKRKGSESPWMQLLRCYRTMGVPDYERSLTKMFVCDHIIANSDRHWNNLGVIVDAETLRPKRVAPIFDSGGSLWFSKANLSDPIDFWYRPLPLIPERTHRIYPVEQLELMRDLEWFDPSALDGFEGIIEVILSKCPTIAEERVETVSMAVRRNIEEVKALQRRVQAPSTKSLKKALGQTGREIDRTHDSGLNRKRL